MRNKTRNAYLRLITAELPVTVGKALETNRELNIAAAHDVLNFKFGELRVEAKLLDNARVLARRQARIIFAFRAGDDHLSRSEDQRGCFGVANPHDDCSKALWMWGKSTRRVRIVS
jgi:hypothetical protein